MSRYHRAFASVIQPEELVPVKVSRLQKNPDYGLFIDIYTITENEKFFLSEDAFKKFLVKLESRVPKEIWIDLTPVLKLVSFLRTNAYYMREMLSGLYATLSTQLEIICRPRVRAGYCRLYWKCVSSLILVSSFLLIERV
jgi:hypothetical protein